MRKKMLLITIGVSSLMVTGCGENVVDEYKSGLSYIYSKSEELHYFHLKELDTIEEGAESNTVILEYNSSSNTFNEYMRGDFEPIREQYNTPYIIDYDNEVIYNLETDKVYSNIFESCSMYITPCYFFDDGTVAILDYDTETIIGRDEDYVSTATLSILDLETNEAVHEMEFDMNLQFSSTSDEENREYYTNGNGVYSLHINLKEISEDLYAVAIYQTNSIPGNEYYNNDDVNYFEYEEGYALFSDFGMLYHFDFLNETNNYIGRTSLYTDIVDMYTEYDGFVNITSNVATVYDPNYVIDFSKGINIGNASIDSTLYNDFSYAAYSSIIGPNDVYIQYDKDFNLVKYIDVEYHIIDKISEGYLLLNDRNPLFPKNTKDRSTTKNYYIYDIEKEDIIFAIDSDEFYKSI